jgi:hypothetical protein
VAVAIRELEPKCVISLAGLSRRDDGRAARACLHTSPSQGIRGPQLAGTSKITSASPPIDIDRPSPSFTVGEASILAGMGSGLVDDCLAALTPTPQQRGHHANEKVYWNYQGAA